MPPKKCPREVALQLARGTNTEGHIRVPGNDARPYPRGSLNIPERTGIAMHLGMSAINFKSLFTDQCGTLSGVGALVPLWTATALSWLPSPLLQHTFPELACTQMYKHTQRQHI